MGVKVVSWQPLPQAQVVYQMFLVASFKCGRNKWGVPNFLGYSPSRTPANFGRQSCFSVIYFPGPSCIPNLKLLSLTVAEINCLLWSSTVVSTSGRSACRRQWLLGLQACARTLVFFITSMVPSLRFVYGRLGDLQIKAYFKGIYVTSGTASVFRRCE